MKLITKKQASQTLAALDRLGAALADHDHVWTKAERAGYEMAVRLMKVKEVDPTVEEEMLFLRNKKNSPRLKYITRKDIIIPRGTILTDAPAAIIHHAPHAMEFIGFGRDHTASFIVSQDLMASHPDTFSPVTGADQPSAGKSAPPGSSRPAHGS